MAKTLYRYNIKTCTYDKVEVTAKSKALRFAAIFLASSIVALSALYTLHQHFESPKERLFKAERLQLEMNWAEIIKEINNVRSKLTNLQAHDEDFRVILELDSLTKEIREAGTGGNDQLAFLQSQNLIFRDKIIEAYKKINKLKAQLQLQESSLDTLGKYASDRDMFLARLPAILPVKQEELRRISLVYGERMHPTLNKLMDHKGLDFMGPYGTSIYATADGVVISTLKSSSFGNVILIDHGNGYKTRYAHLYRIKPFAVKKGQAVKRGELIGYMGSTGRSAGPHLHYEVLKDNEQVDPNGFFELDLDTLAYAKLLELAKKDTQPLD